MFRPIRHLQRNSQSRWIACHRQGQSLESVPAGSSIHPMVIFHSTGIVPGKYRNGSASSFVNRVVNALELCNTLTIALGASLLRAIFTVITQLSLH